MSTLTPLERVVYPYVCRGFGSAEIARQLNNKWSWQAIDDATTTLLKRYGKRRIELILDYVDAHCPQDKQPYNLFKWAAETLDGFFVAEKRVLAEYLRQWQRYRTRATTKVPSNLTVSQALRLAPSTVHQTLGRAYRRVDTGRCNVARLLCVYYLAIRFNHMTRRISRFRPSLRAM